MLSKKNLLLLLITILAISVITVFWNLRPTSLPNPTERLEAEKEIYSLLLVGLSSNEGIALAEYTTLGFLGYEGISQDDFSEWDDKNSALKRETFSDFVKLNQQSYSIREYLPKEISDQMIGQQDWSVSLSRIGFNQQLTQALVVSERNMGCDSKGECCYNEGSVLFLQKKDGYWIIQDELTTWLGECAA